MLKRCLRFCTRSSPAGKSTAREDVTASHITGRSVVPWVCVTAALGAAAAVARIGLRPESQLFGRTLIAGQESTELALTYDDGPNDRSTPELLEVLDRFGVCATFFMVGKFVRQRPDLARLVHAAGHVIGNHTMTHPFLANKSLRFVEEELRGCNDVLQDALGEPIRYFRAPFGARRPAVLRCARSLGLTPVQWNVQGNDWEPIGAQGIIDHLERGIARAKARGQGSNILLHDGFDQQMGYDRSDTVRATAILLTNAAARGERVVTLDAWE